MNSPRGLYAIIVKSPFNMHVEVYLSNVHKNMSHKHKRDYVKYIFSYSGKHFLKK